MPLLQAKKPVAIYFYYTVFFLGCFFSAWAQPPAIVSFSPNPVCQGEAITITGTGFIGAKFVTAGNSRAI